MVNSKGKYLFHVLHVTNKYQSFGTTASKFYLIDMVFKAKQHRKKYSLQKSKQTNKKPRIINGQGKYSRSQKTERQWDR